MYFEAAKCGVRMPDLSFSALKKSATMSTKEAVPRISKACNECKDKKRRCDRAEPRCGFCTQRNVPCEYRVLHKPGLPVGYGTNMLERLTQLETKFTEGIGSTRDDIQRLLRHLKLVEHTLHDMKHSGGQSQGAPSQGDSLTQTSTFNRPLNSTTYALQSQETFSGDATQENGALHFLSVALPGSSQHPVSLEQVSASWPLPSMLAVTRLVDRFFAQIYPGFRVVHPQCRQSLLDSYSQFLVSASLPSEAPPHLLGVLLCALRFSEDLLTAEAVRSCREFCKTTIVSQCLGISTIEQLQAMALVAYDLYGKANNPETWGFISLVSSALVHLNLTHTSPSRDLRKSAKRAKIISVRNVQLLDSPDSAFDEECRSNLMWEIFILDRLSSVSNSFPCKVAEEEIDRLLPINSLLWMPGMLAQTMPLRTLGDYRFSADSAHYDSASFLIEIIHILGRVHSFLRSSLDILDVKEVLAWQMRISELDSELQAWKNTLPKQYVQFLETGHVSFERRITVKDILFFSLYHMTVIRLNSAVGYQHFHESTYFMLSDAARSKCLSSAKMIVSFSEKIPALLDDCREMAFAKCGPFYGFTVWVGARLLLVNSINAELEVPTELDQLVSILAQIGQTWESSAKYSDILSFLKDDEMECRVKGYGMFTSKFGQNTHADNNHEVDDEDESDEVNAELSNHSKSARILADMRFNAYSLDVLLLNKIENFKQNAKGTVSPNNHADISTFFEWFKIPITDLGSTLGYQRPMK